MFSHDVTLKEFISPIPICQPEADLGSILHIFHQTKCDSLAISGKNNTWGTISSEDLLSFIAKSWQQLPIATIGHPRKTLQQQDAFSYTTKELHSLIKPVTLYQVDTPISEFLKSLGKNHFYISQSDYLVVNYVGELQGKLDQGKLLTYVASRFREQSEANEMPRLSNPLWSLIDNLALPLKIETEEPTHYYENRCWQKLISKNRDADFISLQKLNVSIAYETKKQQVNISQYNTDKLDKLKQNQSKISQEKTDDFCCLEDSYYSLYPSKVVSQGINITNLNRENHETNKSLAEYSDNLAMSCLLDSSSDKLNNDLPDDYISRIKVEEDLEWKYIKIPLRLKTLGLEESPTSRTKIAEHWLVLAIKSSLLDLGDFREKQFPGKAKYKSIFDKLLSALSHELKSPLTGIIGLSNLLGSQKIGSLNQRQIKYTQLINNSGLKLMTIVNDLIELTSLTTGNFSPQPESIELKSLLTKLYQQVVVKCQTLNSAESDLLISTSGIVLNIPAELEIAIADRLCLSSAISHLMWETIQFCGSPSMALNVEVRNVGGYKAITVKSLASHASVIPPEDLSSNSPELGLNLVIAQYLAKALQGDVQSKYWSQGCSFTLLFPIIEPEVNNSSLKSPLTAANNQPAPKNLTILCLYPELEVIDTSAGNNDSLDFNLKKWAEQDWSYSNQEQLTYRHRIIEANGLEQAHTLARIWQLDVIVLDGYQIANPSKYLRSLQESKYLSALPLITLDKKTTEAANQIEGLNVYPCLLPAQCRSIKDLMQVIQIATEK